MSTFDPATKPDGERDVCKTLRSGTVLYTIVGSTTHTIAEELQYARYAPDVVERLRKKPTDGEAPSNNLLEG